MELVPASRFSIDDLTAAYNGTKLGLCMLGVRKERAWLTRLGVLPALRRNGCGQAMVEHCIEQAARRGAQLVTLEVIIGNEPAFRLFEKLGFRHVRRLVVLRRPPGTPPANHHPPAAILTWLDTPRILACAAARPWQPAWTNQTESLCNAGDVQGLHIEEEGSGRRGWASYQRSALQLTRLIIGPDGDSPFAPAYTLLHHLHMRFPTLDTIAENVPADAPHLDAFYAHGYVNSFARVEMALSLEG